MKELKKEWKVENKLDAKAVFNHWKDEIETTYQQRRFLSQCRDEIIGMLFENFLKYGIELEDAKRYANDVEKFLVTKEGSKGKGKYKGWTSNVEKDFDVALVDYYQSHAIPGNRTVITKDYGKPPYMPYSPIITAWAQDRFGIVWNDEINLLAHMYGHRFNYEFQQEVLDSTWAVTGKDAPEWAKKLFDL